MSVHRKNTNENTNYFSKLSPVNLQVKKLSSMFVSASNNPLVSDEIRPPETNIIQNGKHLPVCFKIFIGIHCDLKEKFNRI
jgi:hypothetical protein